MSNTLPLAGGSSLAPVLSLTGTPPDAVVGKGYFFRPLPVGGAPGRTLTFSLTAGTVPDGFTFSTHTGTIRGSATTSGTTSGLTISVTDGFSTATLGPLSITVAASAGGGGGVPVNLTPPSILGIMSAGQDLTLDVGTYTNNPTDFYYSWRRNGTPISGAFSATYTQVLADEGQNITCGLVPRNASGDGAVIATPARKCLAKTRQASGNGCTTTLLSTVAGGNRLSSLTRLPFRSRSRIYRMRVAVAVFSPELISNVITDTLFTGERAVLSWQHAMSRAPATGVTGVPARDIVFKWGGSNTGTYNNTTFSTGANDDTGVVYSDWIDFGKNPLPAEVDFDTWSAISRPATNANPWVPVNRFVSNFIERYAGVQEFTTDCVADGLAISAATITKAPTSAPTSTLQGWSPLYYEIETDAGTECVVIMDSDSIAQGQPYDAMGGVSKQGTVYSDTLGTKLMSAGYLAVGLEKLGINHLNLGRGSDGTKYTRTKFNQRYRLGIYGSIPGLTAAIAENGHNDFSAGITSTVRANGMTMVANKFYHNANGIYLCTVGGVASNTAAPTGGDRTTPVQDGTATLLRYADFSAPATTAYGLLEGIIATHGFMKAVQPNVPLLRAKIIPDALSQKNPSAVTQSGTTVTVAAPVGGNLNGIVVGSVITMAGQAPTTWRGTFTVTSVNTAASPPTFSYETTAGLATITNLGNYSDNGASEAQMVITTNFEGGTTSARGIFNAELDAPAAVFKIDGKVSALPFLERASSGFWVSNGEPFYSTPDGTHVTGQGADRGAQGVVNDFNTFRASRPLAA